MREHFWKIWPDARLKPYFCQILFAMQIWNMTPPIPLPGVRLMQALIQGHELNLDETMEYGMTL